MTSRVNNFLCILLGLLCLIQYGLSDSDTEYREIPVTSVRPLPLYSKPLNNQGDTLIIGSPYVHNSLEEVFPGYSRERRHCRAIESTKYDEQQGQYRTKILKRASTDHFEVSSTEQNAEVVSSEYFVQFGADAISCIEEGASLNKNRQSPSEYVQIDNTMVSIKDIHEIKYYSGVSVKLSVCGGRKCVIVEERKCLAKTERGLVQFKCEFEKPRLSTSKEIPPAIIPNLKMKFFANLPFKKRVGYVEYFWHQMQSGEETVSGAGKSFRIGLPHLEPSDEKQYKVWCQPPTTNPNIFFPEVFQEVGGKYAKMNQTQFDDSFTVVDEKIQYCRSISESPLISTTYYRVQFSVIGKCDVKKIRYGPGVTELYSIHLPNNRATIRYTEVKYYDGTFKRATHLNITFAEDSTPKMSKVYHPMTMWESLDIVYKLDKTSVFSTFISSEGYDLQVGSKPLYDLEIDNTDIYCKKDEWAYKPNTELKLIAFQDGLNYAVVGNDVLITHKYISQEIWGCYSIASYTYPPIFYRIVNRLELLVPVHSIQSYDGVEIIRRPSGKTYRLEIFEVKYLVEDGKPVFLMAVQRFYRSKTHMDTAHSISEDYYTISKNEIYPRSINHIQLREHNKKDQYWSGTTADYSNITINEGDSTAIIKFAMSSIQKIEETQQHQPYLLLCQPSNLMERTTPYFEIMDDRSQNPIGNNIEDRTLDSKYFTNFVWKSWSCKASQPDGQTEEFTRLMIERDVKIGSSDYASLKEIQYTPVDDARFDLLSSEDDSYRIKLEGVRYYLHTGQSKDPINFAGYSILENVKASTNWQSGTKIFNEPPLLSTVAMSTDYSTRVYYDLNQGRKYMFYLPGNQSTADWNGKKIMRIGSKWEELIDLNANLEMECHESDELAQPASINDTKFLQTLVRTYPGGIVEENLYNRSTRVWECVYRGASILRVINNFILEPTNVENIKIIEYFDGVAVFSGKLDDKEILEIAEIKYLDRTDMKVMKYEGALNFPSETDVLGLQPIYLSKDDVAIQDVNHILRSNEVFRTRLYAQAGATLEIEGAYESPILEDTAGEIYQFKIRCVEIEEEDVSTKRAFKDKLLPIVVLLQTETNDQNTPTVLDETRLVERFKISRDIWECREEAPPTGNEAKILYRIKSNMQEKDGHAVSRVFHRDAVKISMDVYGKVEIEDIMYLLKGSGGMTTYTKVRFEGLVILPYAELLKKLEHNNQIISKYNLDKPILQLAAPDPNTGATIEVGSMWEREIRNFDGEIVTCVINRDVQFTDDLQPARKVNQKSKQEKSGKENQKPIEMKIYEEWSCKNKVYEFTRLVMKLIMMEKPFRVYYPAGGKVGALLLPNDKKALQITQVKFFSTNDDRSELIKYIGKLKLVRTTLIGAEAFLDSFHTNKEPDSLYSAPLGENGVTNITLTLDSMRFYAFGDLGETKTKTDAIKFDDKRGSLQTKFIDEKSNRMFQVGRFWDEELNPSHGKIDKCYFFTWDDQKPKYTPRVAEYIGQKLYTLTKDEFDEIFTIIDIKVWLCTNKKEEFLKVNTVYESMSLPFAVRYTDGIKVEIVKRGGENGAMENAIQIQETVYLDTMAKVVYKYAGQGDTFDEYVVGHSPKKIGAIRKKGKQILKTMRKILS